MQYFLVPLGVDKTLLNDGEVTLRANLPKQVTSQEELESLENLG